MGNYHARFLEGWGRATVPGYSAEGGAVIPTGFESCDTKSLVEVVPTETEGTVRVTGRT